MFPSSQRTMKVLAIFGFRRVNEYIQQSGYVTSGVTGAHLTPWKKRQESYLSSVEKQGSRTIYRHHKWSPHWGGCWPPNKALGCKNRISISSQHSRQILTMDATEVIVNNLEPHLEVWSSWTLTFLFLLSWRLRNVKIMGKNSLLLRHFMTSELEILDKLTFY